MRRLGACVVTLLSLTSIAAADRHSLDDDDAPQASSQEQVVLINASPDVDAGQIARLHRVLDQRGLLFHLSDSLEAMLEGRNVLASDLDAIKAAYAGADWAGAEKIINDDEKRLLAHGGADVATSLSLLYGWRGLIAGAQGKKDDDAMRYFRAALRLNPAWQVDKKIPSPDVKQMIAKAHHEVDQSGLLKIVTDPNDAAVAVDGNPQRGSTEKLNLKVGLHLVQISADAKKTHSEMVDIDDVKVSHIDTTLDPEGELDKAAKLVDENAATPPGTARLERARAFKKLTSANRFLMIEGNDDSRVRARLYDVAMKKVSKPLSIDGNAASALIAGQVKSALGPGNSNSDVVVVGGGSDDGGGPTDHPRWYNRWYVWAGAAVLLGGIVISYELSNRDPTSLRGF